MSGNCRRWRTIPAECQADSNSCSQLLSDGQYDQGGYFRDLVDAADDVAGQSAQTVLEVALDDQCDAEDGGQGDHALERQHCQAGCNGDTKCYKHMPDSHALDDGRAQSVLAGVFRTAQSQYLGAASQDRKEQQGLPGDPGRDRQQGLPFEQQPQSDPDRTDRSDMGILHDRQETFTTTACRQAVTDVGQTVQVQGAGDRCQGRDQQGRSQRAVQPGCDHKVQPDQQAADRQPDQREPGCG